MDYMPNWSVLLPLPLLVITALVTVRTATPDGGVSRTKVAAGVLLILLFVPLTLFKPSIHWAHWSLQVKVVWTFGILLVVFHWAALLFSPVPQWAIRVSEYLYYSVCLLGVLLLISASSVERSKLLSEHYEVLRANVTINEAELAEMVSRIDTPVDMRHWIDEALSALRTKDTNALRSVFEKEPFPHERWGVTRINTSDGVEWRNEFWTVLRELGDSVRYSLFFQTHESKSKEESVNNKRTQLLEWPFFLVAAIALRLTKVTVDLCLSTNHMLRKANK